jgi:hypothetical protein
VTKRVRLGELQKIRAPGPASRQAAARSSGRSLSAINPFTVGADGGERGVS